MKVSIGSKIVEGPWGGGNLFVKNMTEFLIDNGHQVIYDLSEPDIDLILLTDPRSRKESSSTFNHVEILKYKKYVNKNVVVVQRINECDERKGTDTINNFYLDASNCADHIIFVSSWLREIYLNLGMEKDKTSVILAGANSEIFNPRNASFWDSTEKIKLLTHHWSNHKNKGFEIYKKIDDLISTPNWHEKIEFTYIGNINENYDFKNTNIMPPLAGKELANEIRKHHIYITASENEPSGNHHIEAAQCGLPILYIESGGIPEYCKDYGVSFSNNFEEKLEYIIENYDSYKLQMKSYPFNAETMCIEFYDLFTDLLKKKNLDPKNSQHLIGRFFILKNKFLKLFRDQIYLNIKSKVIFYLRSLFSNG